MNICEVFCCIYMMKDSVINLNGLFHKMSIFNQDNRKHCKGRGFAMDMNGIYALIML